VPAVEEDLGGDVVRGAAEGVGAAAAWEDLSTEEGREFSFPGASRVEKVERERESAGGDVSLSLSLSLSVPFFLASPTLANPMSVTLMWPDESSRRFSGCVVGSEKFFLRAGVWFFLFFSKP